MKLKKLILTISLMAYVSVGIAAEERPAIKTLPATACSGLSIQELTLGCKVTANTPNTLGDVGVQLYMASGNATIDADVKKSLDKLIIFVRGYGEYLDTPQVVSSSLEQLKTEKGVSVLIIAPGAPGDDSVQDNAAAFEKTLMMINKYRGWSNPKYMTVVGYSLGGLVSRYALANMEKKGINHHINTYVSYDTPHTGIHVPQGIQNVLPIIIEYVNDANALSVSLLFLDLGVDIDLFAREAFIKVKPELALFAPIAGTLYGLSKPELLQFLNDSFKAQLGTKVFQQLLVNNVYDAANSATIRTNFNTALAAMGYPKNTYNIAVSNGNLSAKKQVQTNNTRYFMFDGKRLINENDPNYYYFTTYNFYPTAPNQPNIDFNFGKKLVVGSGGNSGSLSIYSQKSRVSPSDVLALDNVSGGRRSLNPIFSGVATAIDTENFFYTPELLNYTGKVDPTEATKNYYSFIPTSSAIGLPMTTPDSGLASIVANNGTPFDLVIANGDEPDAAGNNHNHTRTSFTPRLYTAIVNSLQ